MVIRMKHLLPQLICPKQGAFISGHNIFDNILIASKFIYDLRQASMHQTLIAIKLYIERAYDNMS